MHSHIFSLLRGAILTDHKVPFRMASLAQIELHASSHSDGGYNCRDAVYS